MREYGLLLHISSLPSLFGIGDMGPAAYAFTELLHSINARSWQILPLNPTEPHLGNSPYASPSAFAGNSLFISPEVMLQDGFITEEDIQKSLEKIQDREAFFHSSSINYQAVLEQRQALFDLAFSRIAHGLSHHEQFQRFCEENAFWLDDYARFICLKSDHDNASWVYFAPIFKWRDEKALEAYDKAAFPRILREKFIQYLFHLQWHKLKLKCHSLGITLIGDVPIYVTHDSADVWAHQDLFYLDAEGNPSVVAGVPPDYFSPTGQRWGSPLYKWKHLQHTDFLWWEQRLKQVLAQVDFVRLDHFRGFCGYWEIPASEPTAIKGVWKQAPGKKFLEKMKRSFTNLPFIAEDLGIITDDVRKAMRDFHLPGMHVLQFAFGGDTLANNPDVPFAHTPCSIVYTGTHDNPPTKGWFDVMTFHEKENLSKYVGYDITKENITPTLLRLAFSSVSKSTIVLMQDALNLDISARTNTPGTTFGNWQWRLTKEEANKENLAYLASMAKVFGRG